MGDNKSIEELVKDFKELQLRKIRKQVNTNTGVLTGSIGSNFPIPNNYEHGETSNPIRNYELAQEGQPLKKLIT